MPIDGLSRVIPHPACPSAHLAPPTLFHARGAVLGVNAVAGPWQEGPADLPAVVVALRRFDSVAGMIVTIPHKQTAAVQARGACIHFGDHMLAGQIDRFIGALLGAEPDRAGAAHLIRLAANHDKGQMQ